MDFSILKTGFKEYLEQINNSNATKQYETENTDKSIFLYADEFQEYIEKELNISSYDLSEEIENITSSELLDALLEAVNKEETEEGADETTEGTEETTETTDGTNADEEPVTNTEETDANTETTEDGTEQSEEAGETEEIDETEMLLGIIEDMLSDAEFKDLVDVNDDGKIDKEELLNLINTMKNNDSNEENLSLQDVISTGKEHNEGEFEITTPESLQESVENETPITAPAAAQVGNSNSYGSSSGGMPSYNQNPNQEQVAKTLENMNVNELQQEVNTREANFENAQENIKDIEENSREDLKDLKAEADDAFSTYIEKLEKLEPEKAALLNDLTKKKETVDKNNIAIKNHELTVSQTESELSNIASRKTTLEGKKAELEGALGNSETSENQKATIQNQIASIEAELEALKNQETEAKAKKEEAEKEILRLTEENTTLQEGATTLEEQIAALEEEISQIKDEELQNAKKDYEDKKLAYENARNTALEEAQATAQKAQNELVEAQNALAKRQNEEAEWKYSPNGLTEITQTAIELAYSQLGVHENASDNRGEMEKYGAGAGNAWCAAFVSWLYGKGQAGNDTPIDFTAGVSGLRDQGIQAGYYSEVGSYTPVPGDIMIQKENGASHTGIVVGYDGEYVYTIEGNTSDAVRERRYRIGSDEYSVISGYIRMNEWTGGSSNIPTDTYLS